jgi:hypothetical protein
MAYLFHGFERAALAALRQWPMRNRCAIQSQPSVVSRRNRRANSTFTPSAFRRNSKPDSRQPACASPAVTNRSALASCASRISSP